MNMASNSKDKLADEVVAVQNEKQNRNDSIYFSEALEKTGYGIFNYSLIFLVGLVLSYNLFEIATLGFILPIAECDLKLTNKDKGIWSTIGFIGIIVSSHLWGFLADTKGRRAVILPSLLISSTVSILSSFSHRFWLLILLKFTNGFFISASFATIFVYIGEFHIDRTRTRAIMASSCLLSIGGMLLPILSWVVINQNWSLSLPLLGIVYKPWRLLIVVFTCPGFISGLILFLFPESPKFLLSIGKKEEAIKVLKNMYAWNVGSGELHINDIIPDKDTTVQNLNEPSFKASSLLQAFLHTLWKQTVPLFEKSLLLSTVLICTIQFCIYIAIHGMFIWYPYITDTMVSYMMSHNSSKSYIICDVVHANQVKHNIVDNHCTEQLQNKTFIYSFIMQVFFGVEYVVIGLLARKVQKKYILFSMLLLFGTCGAITNFIYETTLALIVYNMFFLSGAAVQVLSGIIIEQYPTNLRGMAICISVMFGRLGGVVGANVAGLLMANNCEMTFYIAGFSLIVSAFLTFLIPKMKYTEGKEDNVVS